MGASMPGCDLKSALARTLLGILACVGLQTAFGLFLVRGQARTISAKMELFLDQGMAAVVEPDDPLLTGLWHQAGSAFQLGVSLGILAGLVAAGFALLLEPAKKRQGFGPHWPDLLVGPVCLLFVFSQEASLLSLLFALLTPLAFRISWMGAREENRRKKRNPFRVFLFAALLILAAGSLFGLSPHRVRDSLLGLPVGRHIVHFYYEHTPLAAHVIQPLRHQAQKAVVQCDDLPIPELLPDGCLWILSSEPCRVKGASVVICQRPLDCPRSLSVSPERVKDGKALIEDAGRKLDPNRAIRRGVLVSVAWGLPAMGLLVALWLGIFAEDLWSGRKGGRCIVLAATLSLLALLFWSLAELEPLRRDPTRAKAYAASGHAHKRYLALVKLPDRLSAEDLERLASDLSPRVRHAAFVEMARRGDGRFQSVIQKGLEDPVPLVRAKAAWALAKAAPEDAMGAIEKILARDPSWYVRDNAYRASWDIRPGGKIVRITPGP